MRLIAPLIGSLQATHSDQRWQLAGIWRRSINLQSGADAMLTLHRIGSGISPAGWVLRGHDFDQLRQALGPTSRVGSDAHSLTLGGYTICAPQRRCSLRLVPPSTPYRLAASEMQRAAETGLFGPLWKASMLPLPNELRQFAHAFGVALNGQAVDWREWLGKGPGLTPSHDDTLTGMLLAAWYFGALNLSRAAPFFAASSALTEVTTAVSVNYLHYAAMGCFSSPLLHFAHALSRQRRLDEAIDAVLALGHTSGADTLLGFWAAQQIIKGTQ